MQNEEISNGCKKICLHIKVAELNTLSVGKGITGIPSTVFNETENTNENTNLRQLSRPQTINLYDGFVCHDDVVVVASTSDYRLGRSD